VGRQAWLSVAAVVVFLLAWEGVARLELVSPVLLSSPTRIAATLPGLLGGPLLADAAHTLAAYGLSLAVAVTGGTAVGLLIGWSPTAYAVLNPFVVGFHSLPKIVLVPLVVLWLGIGLPANVFLGAMMAAFPILTGAFSGLRALEGDLLLLARAFGAGRLATLRTVVLPGVLPYVLAGLRVGVNYAMVGVLIAEFYASSRGVGYRMVVFMANFEIDPFFASLVLVAGFMVAVTGVVHALERRARAWRPAADAP